MRGGFFICPSSGRCDKQEKDAPLPKFCKKRRISAGHDHCRAPPSGDASKAKERMCLMNLQLLKSFLAAAKCKNFTQAAQFLNFTQPAISSHITALEKLYGVSLFRREGKNVFLTSAGLAFMEYAEKILADYEQSLREMGSFRQHKATLRIAISTQFINYFLIDILSCLHETFEDLMIEVHRCMTVDATLKETFEDGIYDLAFIHLEVRPLHTNRLLLGHQKIVWAVSSALFEKMGRSQSLYDYPLIGYPKSSVYFISLKDKIDFARFHLKTIYSDSESVKLALLRNLGIALLPEIKIRQELASGAFVQIAPQHSLQLPISLLYRQDIVMTPILQTLFALLEARKEAFTV